MMMQRPVITGDAATIRAELSHKKHVYLVERGNPQALAEGILTLASDSALRKQIATAAYERVQDNSIAAIGAKIKSVLDSLAGDLL
jgi:glycosyltransferase involved in cell wall biosynthesis